MKSVSTFRARHFAKIVFEGLVFFAALKSTDPKTRAALERLTVLRCEVQEQLDIIAPGYLEE